MIDRDPGRAWIEAALAPLRRAEADFDVVPAVMARVLAERKGTGRGPVTMLAGPPRLAWAASFLAGIAVLGMLAGALYSHGASQGQDQSWSIVRSTTRVGLLFAHTISGFVSTLLAAAAPIVRGVWALLEAAAPLFRGAGLVAATCGALSILVSLFIFAQARRTAPLAGIQGGIR